MEKMAAGEYVQRERPLRVGAVTYLNSRPLVVRLFEHLPEAEVTLGAPSELARSLLDGQLDVGLIPSIEYARNPALQLVSDACVACDGPVRSVMLYGRVPPERIETLALDAGSRTSAALAQIILAEQFDLRPRLIELPLEADFQSFPADAILVIGDRGLSIPAERFHFVWDLGERWQQWQRLPFVFALWVARPEVATPQLANALGRARNEGVTRLAEIADGASRPLGVDRTELHSYLRDSLRFTLGPRERQGMQRFFALAEQHRLNKHLAAGLARRFSEMPHRSV